MHAHAQTHRNVVSTPFRALTSEVNVTSKEVSYEKRE